MHPASINRSRFLFFLAIAMVFSSCTRKPVIDLNESIICDLEQITEDGNFFRSSSHPEELFEGVDKLNDSISRSGHYSVYLRKGRVFGMKYRLKYTSPGQFYEVSVWRKGNGSVGYLAVSDDISKKYYRLSNQSDSIDSEGWERVTLSFYVPPFIQEEDMLIYLWNPEDVDVFFDDLSISRRSNKHYPEYTGIPTMDIFLDTSQVIKLAKKRADAYRKGILETEEEDWVDGVIFIDEEMYHAELRLKGDWLDHLLGLKWSFRIKLEKGSTWNGMRTFSVQNPVTRDFLNEWLLHRFCRSEDILAPRYGFIPLNFNERSRGLYAYEEHFEKFLIEYNNRREGPIVKLNEDHFWKVNLISRETETTLYLPVIRSSEIMPFKLSRTLKDSVLLKQFVIAQDLYHQYKTASRSASDIFDVEKLAKYLAMLDLHGTYHGINWHNQRFYYNPVISKLEPIVFDNFTEKGKVKYHAEFISGIYFTTVNIMNATQLMWATVFKDSTFVSHYIKYLEEYSDTNFIKSKLEEEAPLIAYYDSLIKIEFPYYRYDYNLLINNAKGIEKDLPLFKELISDYMKADATGKELSDSNYSEHDKNELAENFIKVYTENLTDSGSLIRVENYFCKNILILGTSRSEKRLTNNIYPEIHVGKIEGTSSTDTVFFSRNRSNFLYFMVDGDKTTYSVPIMAWRKPGYETPLQRMIADYGDNYLEYFTPDREKGLLTLKEGFHEISDPLIIPDGFLVNIPEGSEIDIINHAPFISYSTINITGTAENPVSIKSSDGTASGFTILQASGQSIVQHTIFDRLNTLDIDGWVLTGAVTFYESDVSFNQSSFQNNLCEDALNIIRSEFVIDGCRIINTFADALDVDFGKGVIRNTVFDNLANDAIDVSGSEVRVEYCEIANSYDKGISGGENSNVDVFQTNIKNSVIGIASKDHSTLSIRECVISECRWGLAAYQKKPEFGPGSIKADKLSMVGVQIPYLIEEGSECIVDDERIKDDQSNVAETIYK